MKIIYFVTLLLTCCMINAQVYSYIDQNGNTIYTDTVPENQQARTLDIELMPSAKKQPAEVISSTTNTQQITDTDSEGIKTIRLSPTTTTPTSEQIANATPAAKEAIHTNNAINQYTTFEITSPQHEETIRNTTGQMTIAVLTEPELNSDHHYNFLIDGKQIGTSNAPSFAVEGLERGEHKLVVEIADSNQQTIAKTKEHTFFIKQTTLADKRRVKPCLIREYGIRPECPLKDKPKPEPRNLLLRVTDSVGITTNPEK